MRTLMLVASVILMSGCLAPLTGKLAADERAVRTHYTGLKFETRDGAFTAVLFDDETPATSAFLQKLVKAKYYDGRQFGRVIPGFVIQEVDRTGGTTDQTEHVPLEAPRNVSFSAGSLGIARDADPNSGGSEFFVMDHATSALYANYTVFAQIVDGLEVVHKIAREPATPTGPASAVGAPVPLPAQVGVHDRVPVDPVQMTRVTVVDVTLSLADAARLPLRVGNTTRTASLRATAEWPADLRANASSKLSWYVASRDDSQTAGTNARDPPPPDLKDVTIVVGNATLVPQVDATNGVLSFEWTPSAPGAWTLHLMRGGSEISAADVAVLR